MREHLTKFLDYIQSQNPSKKYQGISLLCALMLLAIAVCNISSTQSASSRVGDRELPIYCVKTDNPQIALSFDAAWGNEDTGEILSILKKLNVKVTFFMTGGWVENFPEDVKAIYAAGHDLGNHSENHKDMPTLSDEQQKEEIMKVHNKVKELTGYEMFLFRPPYGSYNNNLVINAKDCGYYTIQWDVDRFVINMKYLS